MTKKDEAMVVVRDHIRCLKDTGGRGQIVAEALEFLLFPKDEEPDTFDKAARRGFDPKQSNTGKP